MTKTRNREHPAGELEQTGKQPEGVSPRKPMGMARNANRSGGRKRGAQTACAEVYLGKKVSNEILHTVQGGARKETVAENYLGVPDLPSAFQKSSSGTLDHDLEYRDKLNDSFKTFLQMVRKDFRKQPEKFACFLEIMKGARDGEKYQELSNGILKHYMHTLLGKVPETLDCFDRLIFSHPNNIKVNANQILERYEAQLFLENIQACKTDNKYQMFVGTYIKYAGSRLSADAAAELIMPFLEDHPHLKMQFISYSEQMNGPPPRTKVLTDGKLGRETRRLDHGRKAGTKQVFNGKLKATATTDFQAEKEYEAWVPGSVSMVPRRARGHRTPRAQNVKVKVIENEHTYCWK